MGYATRIFAILSVLLFPMISHEAEAVKLKHVLSIYYDEEGKGLKQPEGVACDEKTLVVADTGNSRLVRYTVGDETVQDGSEINIPELRYPIRVQISSKGKIFALDGKTRRIARLDENGVFKEYLKLEGMPLDETVIARGFKIDRYDDVYVLDIFSGRVIVFNPEGKYQRHIKFPENYGFFSDLAVNDKGDIILLDSVNTVVFSAPKGSNGFSPLTKGMKDYMNFPTGITTDNKGIIYISDHFEAGIVMLGPDGSFQGRQLSMGWKESFLRYPSQLCINNKGKLFIADRDNNRIQIFKVVK